MGGGRRRVVHLSLHIRVFGNDRFPIRQRFVALKEVRTRLPRGTKGSGPVRLERKLVIGGTVNCSGLHLRCHIELLSSSVSRGGCRKPGGGDRHFAGKWRDWRKMEIFSKLGNTIFAGARAGQMFMGEAYRIIRFPAAWLRIFPQNLGIREGSAGAVVPSHLGFTQSTCAASFMFWIHKN